eukprot:m.74592 g.74592  ORF g.74592 m.74592 type:complete len:404 (-) comp24679_c0_seq2:185-1396(-)
MAPSKPEDDVPLIQFAGTTSTLRGAVVQEVGPPFCCIMCHTDRCSTYENRYKMTKFFITMPMIIILGVILAYQAQDLIAGLTDTGWKESASRNATVIFPAVNLCVRQTSPLGDDGDFSCTFTSGLDPSSSDHHQLHTARPQPVLEEPHSALAITERPQACTFTSVILIRDKHPMRCYEFNAVGPRAYGSTTGIMSLSLNWNSSVDSFDHTMVNLFNPKDTDPTPRPSFYMRVGADYYILLSKSIDTNLQGHKSTFYYPVPSDVSLKDKNDTSNSLKFSYQNNYVNLRVEQHTYTWPLFLAAMGGFVSACNYTRMGLLFIYKVAEFGRATTKNKTRRKRRERAYSKAHSIHVDDDGADVDDIDNGDGNADDDDSDAVDDDDDNNGNADYSPDVKTSLLASDSNA